MATTTNVTTATAPGTGATEASNTICVDTQHDDMVHDAQLDYYGCKLATSSSDRTVKIYDVSNNSYTPTATLQGNHTGPVWSLSWSHPKFGSLLASASFDGSILVHREVRPGEWVVVYGNSTNSTTSSFRHHHRQANNMNTSSNDNTTTPALHESSVNDVQFAPHEYGLTLAGASSDGKVSVLTHGQDDNWLVEYIHDSALGVNSISWAPYTAYESSGANGGDGSGNQNGNDEDDNGFIRGEENKEGDGSNLSSSMRLVTGGCDNKIRFWMKAPNANTWVEDTTNQPIASTSVFHSDWIRDVAWAPSIIPNTNIVASCSEDRNVIIWTQKGGLGNEWVGKVLHTFEDPVWRLSWSVTGNILAVSSGDSSVTLWKQNIHENWVQVSSVAENVGSNGTDGTGNQ
mmetsp:Transcript_26832/g.30713  ORF Transcript_26832/g.30713 Transcript_26832/m.30713 type:complete len:402 (+) Transcript_26832:50-1255(+)